VEDLIKVGASFVALAIILVIGVGIAGMAYTTTYAATNQSALTTIWTNITDALGTFTSFFAVLAIAVVGGLALAYVLGFFRGAA